MKKRLRNAPGNSRYKVVLLMSACVVLFLGHAPLLKSSEQLPPDFQGALIFKVLSMDNNLKQRCGSSVKIGVLFVPEHNESENFKNLLLEVLQTNAADKTVQGLSMSAVAIPYKSDDVLEKTIKEEGINTIYLCPGFGNPVTSITKICRSSRIVTFTGVGLYVAAGACVALGEKDNKPEILINLGVSEASGAIFDVRLLKLATVIK